MRGKRKTINSNFSAGELDPRLVPMRSDVQAWQQGLKQMVNMRPLLHGGATTRPGSVYLAALSQQATLIPFEFSESQGYVLCLRDHAIDIFYDDGTYATAVTGAPWLGASAPQIRYAQAGDTMILTNKTMQPQKLTRTGAATFVLAPMEFTLEPHGRNSPFYRYAAPDITLQTSGVTGIDINVTASAPVFSPSHGGYFFRIGGKQMMMTSYLSPTEALFAIASEPLPGTAPTTDWDEEAFSPVQGWPHAVCFHNERLVLAGSLKHPAGLWGSQVADFFNFDLADGTDDKAIWIGVAADKVVSIQHLSSFKHLTVFTDQVELYQPEGDAQPWSPKTAAIRQQTSFGCHPDIKPVRFDEAMIFIQKYGRHVREFLFDAVSQAYSSDALSVMNPSRIDNPVSMTAVTAHKQPVPEQYAFIVMSNGGMAVLHSLRAQRITAWSYWQTNGFYRQACVVNGQVFLLVERNVPGLSGSPVYYLEMLDFSTALDSAYATMVATGGSSASGIPHLDGVVAQAVCNGYAHEPDMISGGVYQLVDDVWGNTTAIIGLPFEARIESMPPEIQVEDGSSRGRPLRIVKAGVQVHESVRMVVGGEGANITNIDDNYSAPPDPQTGMYDFVLLGFDKGKTVTVTCDVPLQLTVLGLALEVVV